MQNLHKGHAETNICWSKLTLKCNTHISIMPKPHVKHDTCNIHI
jgi:hypothetical protein